MNEADEIAQVYNTIQPHFVGLNEVSKFQCWFRGQRSLWSRSDLGMVEEL